ncbi:MAG: aminotransferase class I/II-fold pyridoxal phosphate-dependent enzyme, partial [Kangiellaceae bacterium]|nr:aminotransferase class I/II-fold pyridoxal phosphate-dependent enzyme [Kangiellaceae bacterium]
MYVPNPTWGYHKNITNDAGMEWKEYRYYDKSMKRVNIGMMVEDLDAAPDKSIVLLHSCAHNPTGADPTFEEWKEISDVCLRKG